MVEILVMLVPFSINLYGAFVDSLVFPDVASNLGVLGI